MKRYVFGLILAMSLAVAMSGCKGQKQTQQQLTDMEAKVGGYEQRIASLENQLRAANNDINQMKSLITKIGDIVIKLQKTEETRMSRPVVAAPKSGGGSKKPAPKKHR